MNDLEQLSREAAKVLRSLGWERNHALGAVRAPSGRWIDEEKIGKDDGACVEIMVRVLWPLGLSVDHEGCVSKRDRHGDCVFHVFAMNEQDPMQAFRTAVLRALIEVKK